jgi:hypothetical protein
MFSAMRGCCLAASALIPSVQVAGVLLHSGQRGFIAGNHLYSEQEFVTCNVLATFYKLWRSRDYDQRR